MRMSTDLSSDLDASVRVKPERGAKGSAPSESAALDEKQEPGQKPLITTACHARLVRAGPHRAVVTRAAVLPLTVQLG